MNLLLGKNAEKSIKPFTVARLPLVAFFREKKRAKAKGKEDHGVLVNRGLCERLDFRVRVIVTQVCVLKIS